MSFKTAYIRAIVKITHVFWVLWMSVAALITLSSLWVYFGHGFKNADLLNVLICFGFIIFGFILYGFQNLIWKLVYKDRAPPTSEDIEAARKMLYGDKKND